MEAAKLNEAPAPTNPGTKTETTSTDMLRIKQQMSNQCFEMEVQLNAGRNTKSCSTSEAEKDLPDIISDLEKVKMGHFNGRLALHRMQMWHVIGEKLKENDSDSDQLKVLSDHGMTLCSRIKQLHQECKSLQSEIMDIQKSRLEMKRLTHARMQQIEELTSKNEHPESEKYKVILEKGQANMEKYKNMTVMTQNVLRGILLACKVNWLDDPEVRAIAMTLEESPVDE